MPLDRLVTIRWIDLRQYPISANSQEHPASFFTYRSTPRSSPHSLTESHVFVATEQRPASSASS
jgi:hypothetical protein